MSDADPLSEAIVLSEQIALGLRDARADLNELAAECAECEAPASDEESVGEEPSATDAPSDD